MEKIETIEQRRERLFSEHARRNATAMRRDYWRLKEETCA
jgi:hypothetical protein